MHLVCEVELTIQRYISANVYFIEANAFGFDKIAYVDSVNISADELLTLPASVVRFSIKNADLRLKEVLGFIPKTVKSLIFENNEDVIKELLISIPPHLSVYFAGKLVRGELPDQSFSLDDRMECEMEADKGDSQGSKKRKQKTSDSPPPKRRNTNTNTPFNWFQPMETSTSSQNQFETNVFNCHSRK